MTDVYLVRHFPVNVDPRLCYGATDVELKPNWRADAEALSSCLKSYDAFNGRIFTSPLSRCRMIADHLQTEHQGAVAPGVEADTEPSWPVVDARLREFDFGEWEGRLWGDIPRSELDAWAEDLADFRVPAGDCLQDVFLRCESFLNDLASADNERSEPSGASQSPGPVTVVTHSGVLKCLVGCALSMSVKEMFRLQFDFGSVSHINIHPKSAKVGFVNRPGRV